MPDIRKEVHEEIDRMTERQAVNFRKLLTSPASPLATALRSVEESDDSEIEDGSRLVTESLEWLRQNRD